LHHWVAPLCCECTVGVGVDVGDGPTKQLISLVHCSESSILFSLVPIKKKKRMTTTISNNNNNSVGQSQSQKAEANAGGGGGCALAWIFGILIGCVVGAGGYHVYRTSKK